MKQTLDFKKIVKKLSKIELKKLTNGEADILFSKNDGFFIWAHGVRCTFSEHCIVDGECGYDYISPPSELRKYLSVNAEALTEGIRHAD